MALLRTGEHSDIVFKIELIYFVFSPELLRNHGPALINVFTAPRSPRADKNVKIRNVSGETRSLLLFSPVMRNVSLLRKHPLQLILQLGTSKHNAIQIMRFH